MKSTAILGTFVLLTMISSISSSQQSQCLSCQSILSKLRDLKSSTYCDSNNVNRILCYEIYYYLYNFKPVFFLDASRSDKDANVEFVDENFRISRSNLYSEFHLNEDCDICSAIDKCSFSECTNTPQTREHEPNSDKNISHVNATEVEFIQKSSQVIQPIKHINAHKLKTAVHRIQPLPTKKSPKRVIKNNIDNNFLDNYANILKIKLGHIESLLNMLKTVYDSSATLTRDLANVKLGEKKLLLNVHNVHNAHAHNIQNESFLKEYKLLINKIDDFKKVLPTEINKDNLGTADEKLKAITKEVSVISDRLSDENRKMLNTFKMKEIKQLLKNEVNKKKLS